MGTVLQDIRYGVRQLVKIPGFTLTAVLSLALGIGATTAVFSVVYAILFDPFPYYASDRMVNPRLLTPAEKWIPTFFSLPRSSSKSVPGVCHSLEPCIDTPP